MESDTSGTDPATLLTLPHELQLKISSDLHPFDLLQLSQVCKQLHAAFSDKDVWKRALRETCRLNSVFEPSFPIEEMDVRDLQRAALGPTLWQNKVRRHAGMGLDKPISSIERTFGSDYGPGLSSRDEFFGVSLIPGGRYLISYSYHFITLWDMGPPTPALLKQHTPKVVDTFSLIETGWRVHSLDAPLFRNHVLRFSCLLVDYESDAEVAFRLYEVGPLPEDGRIREVWRPRVAGKSLVLTKAGVGLLLVGWQYTALLKDDALTMCDVSRTQDLYCVRLNIALLACDSFRMVNDYFVGVSSSKELRLWRIQDLKWSVVGDVEDFFEAPTEPPSLRIPLPIGYDGFYWRTRSIPPQWWFDSQSSYVCDTIDYRRRQSRNAPTTFEIVRFKVDLTSENAGRITKLTHSEVHPSMESRHHLSSSSTHMFMLFLHPNELDDSGRPYGGPWLPPELPFYAVMSSPAPGTQASQDDGPDWAFACLQPPRHWWGAQSVVSFDPFTGQLAYNCNIGRWGDHNEIHVVNYLLEQDAR